MTESTDRAEALINRLLATTPVVLMGIVNVTPDSFSDGNQFLDADRAVNHGSRLAAHGAHIIDVSGESTRPGAAPVSIEGEISRVLPVVEQLSAIGLTVSVDTRHHEVARAALDAGAQMINDVSGLHNMAMIELAAERNVPMVIVHTAAVEPDRGDVVAAIADDISDRARTALAAGVPSVVIDPGLGFGKDVAQNVELIRRLGEVVKRQFPVMVGASRKTFVGAIVGSNEPTTRDSGSIVAHLMCVRAGARLLRVHEVGGHRQALAMAAALGTLGPVPGWPSADLRHR